MSKKRILFITKNYPPALGGMENYCREYVTYLRKRWHTVYLIANGRWKNYLPLFALQVIFQWLWYVWKADCIWIGDGSISFFWRFFSVIAKKKRYVTIHALDITRNKWLYQKAICRFVRRADRVVAVSKYAKDECIKRNIPAEKITVITNGIDPDLMPSSSTTKDELFMRHDIQDFVGKNILFSIGRHIHRKWFDRFLEEVMPYVGEDCIYILAWSGPCTESYRSLIASKWLKNIYLVGRISDAEKIAFYAHSDLFIMPNVVVPWDAEWFGIVCIEAWWYGLPVLATGIEWITDAVIDGETWYLLSWRDEWIQKITTFDKRQRKQTSKMVHEHFDWHQIIEQYEQIL